MLKETLKRNKGITLIALVITIIVLLILAGISVSMLAGQNGVLTRATEAKVKSESSTGQEMNNLNGMSSLIDSKLTQEVVGKEEDWDVDESSQTLTSYKGSYDSDKIVIPNKVGNTYIKKIGDGSNALGFTDEATQNKTIEIPEGIEEIASNAFRQTYLSGELKLPSTLKKIGEGAFSNCYYITGSLVIPDSVEEIGASAFYYCQKLTGTLKLGNSIKTMGNNAFSYCAFSGSLSIPNSVTELGDNVFSSNKFTGTLTLGTNLNKIGSMAFSGNTFTGTLNIPKSVKGMGMVAFSGSTFDSIKVDNKKEDVNFSEMAFVGLGNSVTPEYLS